MELMIKAGSIFLLIFVVGTMLSAGLGLTVSEIVSPLRSVRLVVLTLLANFVLMPLAAIAIGRLLRLDEPLYVGLVLLGAAGGAPFVPKMVEIAKGDLALAVGLMFLLTVVTIGFLPLVLPLILPGVSVDPAKIGVSLCITMALPLFVALGFRRWLPDVARRVKRPIQKLADIAILIATLLLIGGNIHAVLGIFGERCILASLLLVAIGYGLGWLLGGQDIHTREGLGMSTAGRNIGAALVVASQNFSDPKVAVSAIIFTIVVIAGLLPLARSQAKRSQGQPT